MPGNAAIGTGRRRDDIPWRMTIANGSFLLRCRLCAILVRHMLNNRHRRRLLYRHRTPAAYLSQRRTCAEIMRIDGQCSLQAITTPFCRRDDACQPEPGVLVVGIMLDSPHDQTHGSPPITREQSIEPLLDE